MTFLYFHFLHSAGTHETIAAKGAFKYYVSAFGGDGGTKMLILLMLGSGVSDKMLTLLTLGIGGVGKLRLRA